MSQVYRLGLYEKALPSSMALEDKLRKTYELGYDYMELSVDESDEKLSRLDLDGGSLKSMARQVAEAPVPIGSICLSGHRRFPLGSAHHAVRTKALEIMEGALRLGEVLGVRTIQLAGYDSYYEPSTKETAKYFEENLRLSVEMASRSGIVLAFETMETPFMDTVAKAMKYVEIINSPYLQVYPDVGNITNASKLYDMDPIEDLKRGRGHLAAVHLKETKPGHYREVEFGEGHVDFKGVVGACLDLGVRRFVTELWDGPQFNFQDHIRRSKAFIESFLK